MQKTTGIFQNVEISTDVSTLCPPKVRWYKIAYDRGRRVEHPINISSTDSSRHHVETYQIGIVTTLSQLVISNVTLDDSGGYKCETTSSGTKGIPLKVLRPSKCKHTGSDKIILNLPPNLFVSKRIIGGKFQKYLLFFIISCAVGFWRTRNLQ